MFIAPNTYMDKIYRVVIDMSVFQYQMARAWLFIYTHELFIYCIYCTFYD